MIKKIVKKQKRGRPSKFNTIDFDQCKTMVMRGFTNYEIADFYKVSESTFKKWVFDNPDFSAAIKDWKEFGDRRVERSLYERACGYTHKTEEIFCAFGVVTRVETFKHYPPDPLSCIIWLKNRQPDKWREKPADPEDERLKDQELVFNSVPNFRDPKTDQRFDKFYGQN